MWYFETPWTPRSWQSLTLLSASTPQALPAARVRSVRGACPGTAGVQVRQQERQEAPKTHGRQQGREQRGDPWASSGEDGDPGSSGEEDTVENNGL